MEKIRKFFKVEDNLEFFAWTLAFTAVGMFLVPLVALFLGLKEYDFTQYATYVGGTAGPLAALAGFIFIYKTLKNQQDEFTNQVNQYHSDKVDNRFYWYLEEYVKAKNLFRFSDSFPAGDLSFKEWLISINYWIKVKWEKDYKTEEEKFNFYKGSGYKFIEKQDWRIETIDEDQLAMFINIRQNEEFVGVYIRKLKAFLRFIVKNDLKDKFDIIDSYLGKYERIFLYYYCSSSNIENKISEYLEENKFIYSVSTKHLEEELFGVLFWYPEKQKESRCHSRYGNYNK